MSDYKKLPQINFRADIRLRDAFDAVLHAQDVDRTAFFTQVMRDTVESAKRAEEIKESGGKSASKKLRKNRSKITNPTEDVDLFAMLMGITTSGNEIAKSGARAAIICAAALVSNGRYRDIKNLLAQARAGAEDAEGGQRHGAVAEGGESELTAGRGAA